MASGLCRVFKNQSIRLFLQNSTLQKLTKLPAVRLISTSQKNKDTVVVPEVNKGETAPTERFKETKENFISYGYSYTNYDFDRQEYHGLMFSIVTIIFCWGGFMMAYSPDPNLLEWSRREAYLVLAKRERDGLPAIDKNLIDPAKITLPTDEELGDTDIII